MQTPTSGVAPDDDDELPLHPLEPLAPDDDEELLLHPLEPLTPEEELLLHPLLDELEEVWPQSTQGSPLIVTSAPLTRATQTSPGLHFWRTLHS